VREQGILLRLATSQVRTLKGPSSERPLFSKADVQMLRLSTMEMAAVDPKQSVDNDGLLAI
jgi:hypothetical protein